jgi:hypothetical protein
MEQKYLPSTTFLHRIGLLFLSILLFIGISKGITYYHAHTPQKISTQSPSVTPVSLKTLADKDTDGDGIPDWKEVLLGTSPTSTDTDGDGVPDIQEITQRNKTLSLKEEPQNESDAFVQNFFSAVLSLKNSGNLTKENMQVVIDELQKSIGDRKNIPDNYTSKNLLVTPTSSKNSALFIKNTTALLAEKKYTALGSEQEAVQTMLENSSNTGTLTYFSTLYIDLASRLIRIPTPKDRAVPFLALINTLHNIGTALKNLEQVSTNPINGLIGLGQYTLYTSRLKEVEHMLITNSSLH